MWLHALLFSDHLPKEAQSIWSPKEHCKTDAGYAAIQDVDTMKQNDRMESFFLAETLKYLYLLQDDTNDIDLLNTVSELHTFLMSLSVT